MNVWISSDSTCLGSNKPHPWASPETSQSLPFSLGYSIKTPLNLAEAKYFPDALASDQLSLFTSCRAGIPWEEDHPCGDRAQEYHEKHQCPPGQAELVQLKPNSAKGWTCPPQHLYLKAHTEDTDTAFHTLTMLNSKLTLNNKIPPRSTLRGQHVPRWCLTGSLCFQTLIAYLLPRQHSVWKPVTAKQSNESCLQFAKATAFSCPPYIP